MGGVETPLASPQPWAAGSLLSGRGWKLTLTQVMDQLQFAVNRIIWFTIYLFKNC